MTVGRFLIGLGVGSAAMVVPLYISELSPARFRGRMVVVDVICITGVSTVLFLSLLKGGQTKTFDRDK